MLGAICHLFLLSLRTPMYETDENKNNGNFRMHKVTGKEILASRASRTVQRQNTGNVF